jgi:hypothetical protein
MFPSYLPDPAPLPLLQPLRATERKGYPVRDVREAGGWKNEEGLTTKLTTEVVR